MKSGLVAVHVGIVVVSAALIVSSQVVGRRLSAPQSPAPVVAESASSAVATPSRPIVADPIPGESLFDDESEPDDVTARIDEARGVVQADVERPVVRRDPVAAGPSLANPEAAIATEDVVPSGVPPERLPLEEPAAPIRSSQSATARAIIANELPQATPEEIDVWQRALQGLPAEMMRDLLRIRRDSPLGVPGTVESPLIPPGAVARPDAPRPLFAPQPMRSGTSPLDDADAASVARSVTALRQALAVLARNVANANTPGYKRSRPLLFEGPQPSGNESPEPVADAADAAEALVRFAAEAQDAADEEETVTFGGVVVDPSPGVVEPTGNPLDVAIAGKGWFCVTVGDETLFTRQGRFVRGPDGDLRLTSATNETPRVEPPLTLPEEAAVVTIAADGTVAFQADGDDEPTTVGQLVLARFADPSRLQPAGRGLYRPTTGSGPARIGNPGRDGLGTIRSGAIEASNVDLATERAAIAGLREQMQILLDLLSPP